MVCKTVALDYEGAEEVNANITDDGTLIIYASNSIESYAVQCWLGKRQGGHGGKIELKIDYLIPMRELTDLMTKEADSFRQWNRERKLAEEGTKT